MSFVSSEYAIQMTTNYVNELNECAVPCTQLVFCKRFGYCNIRSSSHINRIEATAVRFRMIEIGVELSNSFFNFES